ncbi:MAG: bifunctional (p)ppGpp synthetase/guanosine-3',5'-bis(diphosphate) 3'-pyrophosphohydrolase [Lentimicrobiaceae bacterium]|nr:bifunctional (p)ppGpp synthetase/guanosine-3',5'-bis(diphosphate) 3'-pyrophosphohydrolase [Lentimicrobiaceae bacterium]
MADTSKYSHQIRSLYRELLKVCVPVIHQDDLPKIRKAFELVLDTYQDKKMESGEYYYVHAVNVAKIVAGEIGLGTDSIIGALLHNVLYKANITRETIEEAFGQKVAFILQGLAKIAGVSTQRSSLNAENFIKLLLTLSPDVHVILIKLADRLEYMRKIDLLPETFRIQIASETSLLYAPIAHRLGLYHIKTELEELSMRYAFPEIYFDILKRLEETQASREAYIRNFIAPVGKELTRNGFDFEIRGRPKSVSSIWNKMKKQGVEFDEVYDLFAIRIIIRKIRESEKADCWRIYSIVTNLYPPNPKRLRDWLTTPKASGYESLHTTVMGPEGKWVEVQIRTKRMDEIAEKGGAAHWKYKESTLEKDQDNWVSQIRQTLERPDLPVMEDSGKAKLELYTKDIFIFTPKGDIKKLPMGASVLDFAYEIHSSVGNSCTGGKVNHKIVPLRHVLQNGDVVEIVTSKTQKPKPHWINFVVSAKAKSRIRRAIKELQFNEADQGKEILKRKFSQLRLTFDNENIDKLVDHFNLSDPLELYHNLAIGKIDPMEVKDCFIAAEPEKVKPADAGLLERIESVVQQAVQPGDLLLIDGQSDIGIYKFARCCNPVFGDEIFGFVTVGKGIRIHRDSCPNAAQMKMRYGYRIIHAQWVKADEKGPFWVNLLLSGEDRIGIVNQVSHLLSDTMRINIRSFSFESKHNKFEGNIQILVKDTGQLNFVISQIKKLGGVKKIKRLK